MGSVEEQRTKSYHLLSNKFNFKEGVIKINVGNTLKHELAKFLLCWDLAKQDKQFITEAIFNNQKRADILNLDTGEAWEILESETENQFKEKVKDYPCPAFSIKAINVLKGERL